MNPRWVALGWAKVGAGHEGAAEGQACTDPPPQNCLGGRERGDLAQARRASPQSTWRSEVGGQVRMGEDPVMEKQRQL